MHVIMHRLLAFSKTLFILSLLLIASTLVASVGGTAQTNMPQLVINDTIVMTIRTASAGLTPEERAEIVRRRLGNILTMPGLHSEDVQVREVGEDAAIYVRDRLLITIDRSLARANSTTPLMLANGWAETLRTLLPQVNVAVQVPVGPQVVVNNRILMTIPQGGGAYSREERAGVIRRRLGNILMLPDLRSSEIVVRQETPGGIASILVRDRLLISVDDRLAQHYRTTPKALAEQWASNLRDVLPSIQVEIRHVAETGQRQETAGP